MELLDLFISFFTKLSITFKEGWFWKQLTPAHYISKHPIFSDKFVTCIHVKKDNGLNLKDHGCQGRLMQCMVNSVVTFAHLFCFFYAISCLTSASNHTFSNYFEKH